jgi:hypothetical protein
MMEVGNTLIVNEGGIKSDAMDRGTQISVSTKTRYIHTDISYLARVLGVRRRAMQPINVSMVVIPADALVFAVKVESRVKDAEICMWNV